MAWTQKTEYLVGAEKLQRFAAARILVVGVGGVGAFVAEFLARAGIGSITLVDGDVVSDSNRNRQLLALCSTEAQVKVEVMARRLQDINPQLQLETRQMWLTPENVPALLEEHSYDFVVDAIDCCERIAVTNKTEYRYIQNTGSAMSSFAKAPSKDIVTASEILRKINLYTFTISVKIKKVIFINKILRIGISKTINTLLNIPNHKQIIAVRQKFK